MSDGKKNGERKADLKQGERRRVFGRDEREALETQRRATAYGRARGLS